MNACSEDSGAKSLSYVLDSLNLNPLQARSPALHRSSPNLNRNSLILQSSPTQPTEEVCSPSRRRSSSRQSSPRRSSSYRRSGGCREIRESPGSEESSSHLWWNNNLEKWDFVLLFFRIWQKKWTISYWGKLDPSGENRFVFLYSNTRTLMVFNFLFFLFNLSRMHKSEIVYTLLAWELIVTPSVYPHLNDITEKLNFHY